MTFEANRQTNFDHTFAANATFLSRLNATTISAADGNNINFASSADFASSASIKEVFEKIVVNETAASGEININVLDGSLHNFTTNASANFNFNIRGSSQYSLNSVMENKRSLVVTLLISMGSSAYVMTNPSTTGFKIDGNAATVKWIGSSPPSSGFTNSINSYTFAIIKNGSANYTVLGTLTRFG